MGLVGGLVNRYISCLWDGLADWWVVRLATGGWMGGLANLWMDWMAGRWVGWLSGGWVR